MTLKTEKDSRVQFAPRKPMYETNVCDRFCLFKVVLDWLFHTQAEPQMLLNTHTPHPLLHLYLASPNSKTHYLDSQCFLFLYE